MMKRGLNLADVFHMMGIPGYQSGGFVSEARSLQATIPPDLGRSSVQDGSGGLILEVQALRRAVESQPPGNVIFRPREFRRLEVRTGTVVSNKTP
jgi:hypothetical protein